MGLCKQLRLGQLPAMQNLLPAVSLAAMTSFKTGEEVK
jgi:hypothetical protein